MASVEDHDLGNVILESKPVQKVSKAARDLSAALKEQFPDGFSYESLMEVVIFAMRHVALYFKAKSGAQKKKLVSDAIIVLLESTDSGEYEKYEPTVKALVPTMIDNICDIEKTKTKINKGLARGCIYCCH